MAKPKGYRKLEEQAEKDREADLISATSASPLQDYRAGRISTAITSLENIQKHWKNLIPGAHQGCEHTEESRRKIREAVKALWRNRAFQEKMERARRARRFRAKGKCLLKFPRLPASSADEEWLDAYLKRYNRITGKRLRTSAIEYHPH